MKNYSIVRVGHEYIVRADEENVLKVGSRRRAARLVTHASELLDMQSESAEPETPNRALRHAASKHSSQNFSARFRTGPGRWVRMPHRETTVIKSAGKVQEEKVADITTGMGSIGGTARPLGAGVRRRSGPPAMLRYFVAALLLTGFVLLFAKGGPEQLAAACSAPEVSICGP